MDKDLLLLDGEYIVGTIRQSPIWLVVRLILPALCIIAPFFFLYPLFQYGQRGIVVFLVVASVGLTWLARTITIWSLKILTITSRRLIDSDQLGLFRKIVSEIPLEKITDVFYEIKGMVQTLSRMGTLHIIVSDGQTRIYFSNLSRPKKYQQLILQLKSGIGKTEDTIEDEPFEQQVLTLRKMKNSVGEEQFQKILAQVNRINHY